jgi:hypothetical protein
MTICLTVILLAYAGNHIIKALKSWRAAMRSSIPILATTAILVFVIHSVVRMHVIPCDKDPKAQVLKKIPVVASVLKQVDCGCETELAKK